MAQQTAVEWLVNQAVSIDLGGGIRIKVPISQDIIEQAKQMEKEQKEEEYKRGWEDATSTGIKEAHKYQ